MEVEKYKMIYQIKDEENKSEGLFDDNERFTYNEENEENEEKENNEENEENEEKENSDDNGDNGESLMEEEKENKDEDKESFIFSDEEKSKILGAFYIQVKIIDEEFVKNNRNKSKIIFNNKKFDLKNTFYIKNTKKNNLKIKMVLSKGIYNKSYMFYNCQSLLQFSKDNDD